MNTEQTNTQTDVGRGNGADPASTPSRTTPGSGPRVVSDPGEVATLVLMQIDAVNDRKDELSLTIRALSDLTRQLARAFGEQKATIAALLARVKELEDAASRSV